MAPMFLLQNVFEPMKRLLVCHILAATILAMSLSCSEEQDFDQFDDLSITPTVASSLLYLESDEEFINDASVATTFYSQTFNFDAFSEQFVAERLLEGTIFYELENTTSKRLNIAIEFLDEAGNVLDTEIFNIDPEPTPTQSIAIVYGPGGKSLDILTTTSALRVIGSNLGDSTSVSNQQDPKVIVRSAAEFLFRLK